MDFLNCNMFIVEKPTNIIPLAILSNSVCGRWGSWKISIAEHRPISSSAIAVGIAPGFLAPLFSNLVRMKLIVSQPNTQPNKEPAKMSAGKCTPVVTRDKAMRAASAVKAEASNNCGIDLMPK